jgi:hypothetical protein
MGKLNTENLRYGTLRSFKQYIIASASILLLVSGFLYMIFAVGYEQTAKLQQNAPIFMRIAGDRLVESTSVYFWLLEL